MNEIFTALVYQPVYNLLVFFAGLFPVANFGLAIIASTLVIKLVFLSLSKQQIEAQRKMQELQPKMKEVQERYKDDKERQSREIMELYRKHKVNPVMGCLPIVIQIVFLITIYSVIMHISETGFRVDGGILYRFVADPGLLSGAFFGLADLAKPSIAFAVLAAIGQFYQMKMLSLGQNGKEKPSKNGGEPDFATIMNKQMLYMGPVLTLFIGIRFPSALSLYWVVSTAFAIVQQWYVLRSGAGDKASE
ncbi:MAG: membrane protein insertase YidC [Candidatus Moranbacteria bacterium]|nr:membrane protein insertase YidC [Candidatus Moranbacteria bacterium]NTW46050.1 membrane protein insertase YidC [Candidatus Moranbacteria bacterium]